MYVLRRMIKETRRDLTASRRGYSGFVFWRVTPRRWASSSRRFGSAMVLETSGTSRPATWRDKPQHLNLLVMKYCDRNHWRS